MQPPEIEELVDEVDSSDEAENTDEPVRRELPQRMRQPPVRFGYNQPGNRLHSAKL